MQLLIMKAFQFSLFFNEGSTCRSVHFVNKIIGIDVLYINLLLSAQILYLDRMVKGKNWEREKSLENSPSDDTDRSKILIKVLTLSHSTKECFYCCLCPCVVGEWAHSEKATIAATDLFETRKKGKVHMGIATHKTIQKVPNTLSS